MNSVEKSNALAIEICDNKKYRYLYGAKGEAYTSDLVRKLAKLYPSTYTASILKLALQDADKGFKGIDCSGTVCKILGIPSQGSAGLKSSAVKVYPVDKKNAKPGMLLWRSGHIAYVGADLKIYEASSTANDMKVSSFDARAKSFTNLIIAKGSTLAEQLNKPTSSTPASKPATTPSTKTTSSTTSFPKGCAVVVNGTIYANANGTGKSIVKKNATMYVVGASANSKHPYGVAAKKNGARQGWANASILKKK